MIMALLFGGVGCGPTVVKQVPNTTRADLVWKRAGDDQTRGAHLACLEFSTAVSETGRNKVGLAGSEPTSGVRVELSAEQTTQIAQIYSVSDILQFGHAGLFRLCEARANGFITDAQWATLYRATYKGIRHLLELQVDTNGLALMREWGDKTAVLDELYASFEQTNINFQSKLRLVENRALRAFSNDESGYDLIVWELDALQSRARSDYVGGPSGVGEEDVEEGSTLTMAPDTVVVAAPVSATPLRASTGVTGGAKVTGRIPLVPSSDISEGERARVEQKRAERARRVEQFWAQPEVASLRSALQTLAGRLVRQRRKITQLSGELDGLMTAMEVISRRGRQVDQVEAGADAIQSTETDGSDRREPVPPWGGSGSRSKKHIEPRPEPPVRRAAPTPQPQTPPQPKSGLD